MCLYKFRKHINKWIITYDTDNQSINAIDDITIKVIFDVSERWTALWNIFFHFTIHEYLIILKSVFQLKIIGLPV